MKTLQKKQSSNVDSAPATDLLLLPDGRILVHDLTGRFAELLHQLDPNDEYLSARIIYSETKPS